MIPKIIVHSLIPVFIVSLLNFSPALSQEESVEIPSRGIAFGLDILISDAGLGLGGFYQLQFTDRIAGFASLSISEAKDEREIEMFDWWTGRKFVPGKINRFIVIPVQFGMQYRLFKDQIMDNFRPFLSAAIGPSMIYATPYERDFFSALGHGKAYYTFAGYVGFGANFGSESRNLVGINFRYYFIPYWNGIRSMIDFNESEFNENTDPNLVYHNKTQFGGFFITLTFGAAR